MVLYYYDTIFIYFQAFRYILGEDLMVTASFFKNGLNSSLTISRMWNIISVRETDCFS